jgi:hypothetical protein
MGDTKNPEEEEETSQFKVTDRRQFTSEGEVRQEPETEPQPRRKRPRTQTNRTLPRA